MLVLQGFLVYLRYSTRITSFEAAWVTERSRIKIEGLLQGSGNPRISVLIILAYAIAAFTNVILVLKRLDGSGELLTRT